MENNSTSHVRYGNGKFMDLPIPIKTTRINPYRIFYGFCSRTNQRNHAPIFPIYDTANLYLCFFSGKYYTHLSARSIISRQTTWHFALDLAILLLSLCLYVYYWPCAFTDIKETRTFPPFRSPRSSTTHTSGYSKQVRAIRTDA